MRPFAVAKLILTLRCEQSSRLISESLDQQLPWAERWAVRMHFISCRSCRRVRQQFEWLHRAAGRRGESGEFASAGGMLLSPEIRDRIIAAIERHDDQRGYQA